MEHRIEVRRGPDVLIRSERYMSVGEARRAASLVIRGLRRPLGPGQPQRSLPDVESVNVLVAGEGDLPIDPPMMVIENS